VVTASTHSNMNLKSGGRVVSRSQTLPARVWLRKTREGGEGGLQPPSPTLAYTSCRLRTFTVIASAITLLLSMLPSFYYVDVPIDLRATKTLIGCKGQRGCGLHHVICAILAGTWRPSKGKK